MKYETVLFDLDGTLLDTTEGVIESVVYTIKELKLPLPDESTLSTFVGPPMQESFIRVFGVSKDEGQKASETFRAHYKSNGLFKAVPYKGIEETLEKLVDKGYKLAVATYKKEDAAIAILEHFSLSKYFKIIYGADKENKLTKADIIEKCITDTDTSDKEKVVLIGDSEYDAIGAKNANIAFMGVTYGFGFKSSEDVMQYPNEGAADKANQIWTLICN